ncbi:fibronectin type III-like domain-contianing protein [Algibacter lectus]|uniref:fibronectin type III-like domain-contianing protein n=1 Tax=Algibacter lectus TaxID=221126 RepID=UPI00126A4337|nr:fibronectin type III-like domain-contianing protein [Algibacter lectus]
MKIKSKIDINDERFSVSLKVKNIGDMDGTEIVQLYMSPIDKASTQKPIQLKGFERVELKTGEEKILTFNVSPEQFVQYKNNKWIVESGKYQLKIGASSTDIRLEGVIELKGKDVILENGRDVFFTMNKTK